MSTQSDNPYIYADNAATTPLSPVAREAMLPFLGGTFGNPSGIHRVSREAAHALADIRARLARALGARDAGEIYLTSGGSESDNWVLRGAVRRFLDQHTADESHSPHPFVVTSAIEHHAILHCCEAMEHEGLATAIYLPVDAQGHVRAEDLERALAAHEGQVALVSVMLANNEIGTVEDIRELARIAHEHGIPFHTDAVQAVGHIPVDVRALGVDALSLSAHKFHGPRGVGLLYLREGVSIPPLIAGGAQERGERAGTENLAGAAGMTAALESALGGLENRMTRVAAQRDRLIRTVIDAVPDVKLTGDAGPDATRRLPSIASFICKDVDGELLVVLLDRAGVAAATGSACATGSTDPSHVILALGETDRRWNHGTLRLSLADDATASDIDALCERVPACILRARALSGTM